jgi:glutaredoxin-like protein NrdH
MEKNVKLYALSTCIHCKHTKEFLQEHNVDYDCIEVDTLQGDERKKIIEEVREHNPDLSFPTIVLEDKCIVGFKKEELKEALGL